MKQTLEYYENLRKDYIKQAKKLFTRPGELKNLKELETCKIEVVDILGNGAETNSEENVIRVGPYIDGHTIFHELNHVRQGDYIYNDIDLPPSPENPALTRLSIQDRRIGVFFDEGLTDIVSRKMFRNSPYYVKEINEPKMQAMAFYDVEREICYKLADALGLDIFEFSYLVDRNLREGDKTIEKMCAEITGENGFYQEMQYYLDYYGSVKLLNRFAQTRSIPYVGCDSETLRNQREMLQLGKDMVEHLERIKEENKAQELDVNKHKKHTSSKTQNYTFEDIKQDYIKQAKKLFTRPGELRNLQKLESCRFVLDESMADQGRADLDENVIYIGPNVYAPTIYHELNHIREGVMMERGLGAYISEEASDLLHIEGPKKGIFLDEGLTELIAIDMFKHSPFYNKKVDDPKLKSRVFYKEQMDVSRQFASALGMIDLLEFSYLLDLNLRFGDDTLDKMCEKITGYEQFFELTQGGLDYYGSVQYADLMCRNGYFYNEETHQNLKSCDSESHLWQKEQLQIAKNRIAELEKMNMQTSEKKRKRENASKDKQPNKYEETTAKKLEGLKSKIRKTFKIEDKEF